MEDEKHYFQIKGKNAETFVHNLAEKTFLVDWCYPNPKLSSGNELCDLLVIFDSVAIIWQIKDLKLDKNGKYKKSDVDKNLRQLSGAKRQLFGLKTSIELSNKRRKETFDPGQIKEIFLISVLMGDGEDYYSVLKKDKDQNIHVFTRDFTQTVLNELDTVSDFCDYLRAKEEFFNGEKRSIIVTGGEENLLAVYIREGHSFDKFKSANNIFIDGGAWEALLKEPRFIKKKEEDRISYGWDGIINWTHEGSEKYELVARELARSNRFERRSLSKALMDARILAHEEKSGANLFRRITITNGVTYCFLLMDDPEPRERRRVMLSMICYFARGKVLQNKKVIGIATEKIFRPTCSYDLVLIDMPEWTKENQEMATKIQEDTGMFLNAVVTETSDDEFPA
ncbi:hypothetical protein HZA75_03060 [Candidatus Roizmanbacteria bacterium]|nr:hypothetical protein [Candidatus Roizmanbacteria bacterium]